MRKRRLKLKWPQVQALREFSREVDIDKFRPFEQVEDTVCVVGEEEQKLQRFLGAILNADILVLGQPQRMVQKFLALYHDPARPKIVIILSEKNDQPDHLKSLGIEEPYIRSLPININELNQEKLKASLKQMAEELRICCQFTVEDKKLN